MVAATVATAGRLTAVSLNKMKSACRIGEGKDNDRARRRCAWGRLPGDWRDAEPIGSVEAGRSIGLTVGNPIFEKQADCRVWAILFMRQLSFDWQMKMRQWTGNPRPRTVFANFFRDRKKPRPLHQVQEKSVG